MPKGLPDIVWIIATISFAAYVYRAYQIGRRRAQFMKFKLKRVAVAVSLYFCGAYALISKGYSVPEGIVFGALLGLCVAHLAVSRPRHNRRLPAHIKRAVIARDLKGQPFDPRVHHIHHVVPFSRGGDNSMSNLKVISKTENLQRRDKMPSLRDLL
jgi:hypothetical protein